MIKKTLILVSAGLIAQAALASTSTNAFQRDITFTNVTPQVLTVSENMATTKSALGNVNRCGLYGQSPCFSSVKAIKVYPFQTVSIPVTTPKDNLPTYGSIGFDVHGKNDNGKYTFSVPVSTSDAGIIFSTKQPNQYRNFNEYKPSALSIANGETPKIALSIIGNKGDTNYSGYSFRKLYNVNYSITAYPTSFAQGKK